MFSQGRIMTGVTTFTMVDLVEMLIVHDHDSKMFLFLCNLDMNSCMFIVLLFVKLLFQRGLQVSCVENVYASLILNCMKSSFAFFSFFRRCLSLHEMLLEIEWRLKISKCKIVTVCLFLSQELAINGGDSYVCCNISVSFEKDLQLLE